MNDGPSLFDWASQRDFASAAAASQVVEKIDIGFPPLRCAEWQDVLDRTTAAGTIWIHASHQWKGVVAETLTAPDLGSRFILWAARKQGSITAYPAPRDARAHRTIMMPTTAIPDLHRVLPLVRIDWGPGWAKFRPAEPGEAAAETIEISEGEHHAG